MSKSKLAIVALCMVAFVAACAKKAEETVVVDPVTTEVPTGKYK